MKRLAKQDKKGCVTMILFQNGLVYSTAQRTFIKADLLVKDGKIADCDYRGEFFVPLRNHGTEPQTIEPGDQIAQMIITPYLTANFVEAQELSDTCRGLGGFGSTGVK